MNIDAKIFNKILSIKSKTHQNIIHHDQIVFSQDVQVWFNMQKFVDVIHLINQLKEKSHLIISLDTEKAFDKIQHPFMIKVLREQGYKEHI